MGELELVAELKAIRKELEPGFSPKTAYPGFSSGTSSSGHCAVVAAIVQKMFGGQLVWTNVNGDSHWFNRIKTGNKLVDVDLTGDQFGREPVQIRKAGKLYKVSKVREFEQLNEETLQRAYLLAKNSHLARVAKKLRSIVQAHAA